MPSRAARSSSRSGSIASTRPATSASDAAEVALADQGVEEPDGAQLRDQAGEPGVAGLGEPAEGHAGQPVAAGAGHPALLSSVASSSGSPVRRRSGGVDLLVPGRVHALQVRHRPGEPVHPGGARAG